MPKITTIIPIHNIAGRGIDRVLNSIYSLELQTENPTVIISDSSDAMQFRHLRRQIEGRKFNIDIQHIHNPANGFNMPVLFNTGIKAAKTPFIHCIGADFLFKPDYYQTFLKIAHKDSFLITASGRLGRRRINDSTIRNWAFPRNVTPSKHGAAACGLQFFHRSFPERFGGYDERFVGWSGMDEEYYLRAKRAGMKCIWVTDTVSLHQYHDPVKLKPQYQAQRKKNWALMDRIREGQDKEFNQKINGKEVAQIQG